MNILVTGAKGMVGTALVQQLKNIRDGKNKTRPGLTIDNIDEYDVCHHLDDLHAFCRRADMVFHLAGTNRPTHSEDYMNINAGFSEILIQTLKEENSRAAIMVSSSVQATLKGRFSDSEYGRSKRAMEELFFEYANATGNRVAVYRFPNIMGHSKPNYNSAVSTFCWAIANDQPYVVNDRTTKLELLYIDDLIEGMLDFLQGKERHCEFDGTATVLNDNGKYCCVPASHETTLGEIVDLLQSFHVQMKTLCVPPMPSGSLAKKLYSLYLTYLPAHQFKQGLKMNVDHRGSFTELLHSEQCGQVSVNISRPGITKGEHWHQSKWEIFMVVSGHGLIQERNIHTGETIEFEVSGEKIEAIYMIPGWTHRIINLSETENLVTVMFCNELFDIQHPDTFFEKV